MLPTLHDRSVQWLLNGYHAINKPKIIKQAFASCRAGPFFNLSFDSLTSREALQRLWDVQKNEPDLWTKISTHQYKLAKRDDMVDTDQEPAFTDDADTLDGSDVAVEAICHIPII
ncbi:hypothetical protein BDR03DRAFT_1008601 [Suillus americanus]|nr:hypothetical protein BDR03DRAFT_1008601 [Suillus americanus]